jgi:hypothetical protein
MIEARKGFFLPFVGIKKRFDIIDRLLKAPLESRQFPETGATPDQLPTHGQRPTRVNRDKAEDGNILV